MLFNQYPIGSISWGTMRNQDLIPVFMDELKSLNPSRYAEIVAEYGLNEDMFWPDDEHEWWESDDAEYLLNDTLFDALNECAAPYMYFGSHPGDGADYGFWLDEGFEFDFDGIKVDDLADVPSDYSGDVLHVNDHGNITLYIAQNGELIEEVWALV